MDTSASVTTTVDTASITATLTSTVLDVITTSVSSFLSDTSTSTTTDVITGNGTAVFDGGIGTPDVDASESEGSYILNTFIGLLIVLVASVFNALGLNITKVDHMRQHGIPKRQRKQEYLRLLWLAGMGMYIASQVFGSPLALKYLRPDWVAPLGSSSLVFNFVFAYWLVGTPVTTSDIRGTAVIILGVILIIVFSSINHGLQQSLSIQRLNHLWSRPAWLIYFIFMTILTASIYIASTLLVSLLSSRASFSPLPSPSLELPTSRRAESTNVLVKAFKKVIGTWKKFERASVARLEVLCQRTGDDRIVWLQGIGWTVAGGSLAGLCLVFTKAAVKIFWLPGHPLVHPSAFISLILVVWTAVLQIICLNRALVCADTVVVVPLFYAGYTVFGFINSLIFYDEVGQYARWVLVAVFLSISVLIGGVVLLSLKSSAKSATDPYTITTEPSGSMRLRPRAPKSEMNGIAEEGNGGPSTPKYLQSEDEGVGRENVLWEVGSVSDLSEQGEHREADEEDGKGKGVGGVRGGTGERRGLLGEEDEDLHEGIDNDDKNNSFEAGDEGFGDYEGVRADHMFENALAKE